MVANFRFANYHSIIVEIKERPTVKDILLILTVGAVVIGSVAMPGLPRILYFLTKRSKKEEKKLERFDHRLFRQELKRLAKRGVVEFAEINGKTVAKLTEIGKERIAKYNVESLEIKKPKKWDGKWRLVIFDIPNKKKFARELFREKLKNLGFYQLQESVFIHPFPCRAEILVLREQLDLTPSEVMCMTIEDIEGEHVTLQSLKL